MSDASPRLAVPLAALLLWQGAPAFCAGGAEDGSGRIDPLSRQRALAVISATLMGGQLGEAADVLELQAPPPADMTKDEAQEFAEGISTLIDEIHAKDPELFAAIRAEEDRIRALPTHEERVAAVSAGYARLDADIAKSAAEGKLSAKGLAQWNVFRPRAQEALADGTLFEIVEFAGHAFDEKVQALLRKGVTKLDADRKLPESKAEYMALSKSIHARLAVRRNSTSLTWRQLDEVFDLVGTEFGIRPEFLKYMAKTESGLRQVVPGNPAAVGIMQIETVHQQAYAGARNVANDTITNIVYGGLLRAKTDREMARRFTEVKLTPPSNPRVVEFLGDLAYNRGPGLLKYVAQYAAAQKIDVNRFSEYLGGPGGSYSLVDDGQRIVIQPGPGTKIDKTGRGSVLERSSEAVGRVKFSKALTKGLGDRNGDGRVDHLDVWLTRGIRYLHDPDLAG